MGGDEDAKRVLAAKFVTIFPHLDEQQRRLLMGAEARALGHGGIRLVARAAGVREATVSLGVDELDSGAAPLGTDAAAGRGPQAGGRCGSGAVPALLDPGGVGGAGDPVSPLRWTTRLQELAEEAHRVLPDPIEYDRAERFLFQYGITKDELISRMGGSP
jgi:hypothetical protein